MSNIVFGIDLGTSNTVISYFFNNKSNILLDGIFKIIPSKIYISPNNEIYCGNYIPIGAENIIHSFKIQIGNNYSIERNNKIYNIQDILNIFINHIKKIISNKFTNLNHFDTVITVPSNFSDNQREIIKSAFIYNNFNIIRIINEPSAAALAYGLTDKDQKKIMVIDTGGGTMDITILEKDDNFFNVIHSIGLNDLGGNDFTNIIVNDIIKKINTSNPESLFYTAQRIKEKLSVLDKFSVNINKINYELSLFQFNKLSHTLLQRIDEIMSSLINEYIDIDYYILVGGSSKLKILQEKIYDITRKKPWIHPNLESVVSEGACLYAAIIKNLYKPEDDILLVDILPLSLGVETADGNFSIVINKDTPLPVKRTQRYTTDSPGNSKININIYQGERKIANKNILIGTIEFDKVSITGIPIIDITFSVDVNGIINIIIFDKKSNYEKSILIKNIPKYNNEELSSILENAQLNNEHDSEMITKLQRIYLIKLKIENALSNLDINENISAEIKEQTQNELNTLEENLDEKTNCKLLEIIQLIDEKYSGLIINNNVQENDNTQDKHMDELERVFMNEIKNDINRRGNMLINQNPDWEEFIKPVLDQIEINNISIDYLQEKLAILKELQNNNEDETRDYKDELKNICIYLKNELNENQLELNNDNKEKLIKNINENLNNITLDNELNWNNELTNFNKFCEEIYSKK